MGLLHARWWSLKLGHPLARPSPRWLLGWVLGTLALFLAIDLLWSGMALAIELGVGDPLLVHRSPDTGKNAADAIWHVATVFLIALPARRAVVWALAPLLALGLDIDHVFGGLLPTVVIRSAHDVFLIGIMCVALGFLRGRPAAFVGVGAILEHLAVDGGGFPLFAPFSTDYFALSYPVQVVFIATAALLLFLSVWPAKELRNPRRLGPVMASIALVAALVWYLWPFVSPFTHT